MPCTPQTQRVVSSQRWEGLLEISGGGEPESNERHVGTRSSEQPQEKWRPGRLSPHSALPLLSPRHLLGDVAVPRHSFEDLARMILGGQSKSNA